MILLLVVSIMEFKLSIEKHYPFALQKLLASIWMCFVLSILLVTEIRRSREVSLACYDDLNLRHFMRWTFACLDFNDGDHSNVKFILSVPLLH